MTKVQSLFDEPYQTMQRQRRGYCDPSTHPLYQEARARLNERRADVKQDFTCAGNWADIKVKEAHDDGGECRSFDLITSCLTLQNANGLQDELAAIYESLAQSGLFLGVLAGGQTLGELRACFLDAELTLAGGASPRLPPLPDAETMCRLLPAAGFALPVVDGERVTLTYPDLNALMRDLRRHGCTNSLSERPRQFTNRNLFAKARELYATRFPSPSGGIVVTVDLIFLHGWKE